MMLLTLTIAAISASAQTCLMETDVIRGEFRYVESRHPNGTDLRYGFVRTPEDVCVVSESAETGELIAVQGHWIQVSWSDDQTVRPDPGDYVALSADCFQPHSAWHLGDIICINARLVSRAPM